MELLNFIKTHDNWEELLTAQPYCLKISRKHPFICFKYSQIDSDFSLQVVREARGIIFNEETWEVCARGFDKFFNYGEPNAAHIDFYKTTSVTEKIDGSLFKVWYSTVDRNWHISTNSTIDAADAPLNCALEGAPNNFSELFYRALKKAGYYSVYALMLDRQIAMKPIIGWTFLFEVVSPYNRVVIPYEDIEIYFLGARNNQTGEWDMGNYFKYIWSPRNIAAKCPSLKRVIEIAESYPWTKEGFVVFDGVNRVKVKSPAYVRAHYARNNGAMTLHSLFDVIINNEIGEFLTYCSECKDLLYTLGHFMENYIAAIDNRIQFLNFDMPRKEFAEQVKAISKGKNIPFFAPSAFKAYDAYTNGATYSFRNWCKCLNGRDWEKVFKETHANPIV